MLPVNRKAVFITGTDSGIGHELAKYLDSLGFTVFVSVLDAAGPGAKKLKETCSERLSILQLDITSSAQIKEAYLEIRQKLQNEVGKREYFGKMCMQSIEGRKGGSEEGKGKTEGGERGKEGKMEGGREKKNRGRGEREGRKNGGKEEGKGKTEGGERGKEGKMEGRREGGKGKTEGEREGRKNGGRGRERKNQGRGGREGRKEGRERKNRGREGRKEGKMEGRRERGREGSETVSCHGNTLVHLLALPLSLAELWAVINNAGILGFVADGELLPMSSYKQCMDVNFFGPVELSKMFLPLLRKSKGRIINISSLAGGIPMPLFAAYGASKAALSMFSGVMRQELSKWGIKVAVFHPSGFKTSIGGNPEDWKKEEQMLLESLAPDVKKDYGEDYIHKLRMFLGQMTSICSSDFSPVFSDVLHALLAEHPRGLYTPGKNSYTFLLMFCYTPLWFYDFFMDKLMGVHVLPSALQTPERKNRSQAEQEIHAPVKNGS
ncbi:estradiol 17-beta-dehydrogenase 2 [Crotalus adamanteus]|uniref:Estradiol 17-beta-dehydrogenase 2 n=1 Tax=Crotalus adamanteus TaxID=8729 RepID=A0AAW1ASC1_CROAD